MQPECIPDLFGFVPVEGRRVVAAFDGGSITSDAGALLLGATDRGLGAAFLGNFRGEDALHSALGVPDRFRWLGAVLLGEASEPDPPSSSASR